MYTEVIKIIEGALAKDVAKVTSYSRLLAENLEKKGETSLSRRILDVLAGAGKLSAGKLAGLDQFMAPVDQESRLEIVDVVTPNEESAELVLPPQVDQKVSHFLNALNHREKLSEYGIPAHATLLLYGPPGCGKTSLAHLIAHRIGLPLVIARFDSLISPLLGNTSKNIRKVFDYADGKPCVLFLDEFDAIAKARDDQFELGELKRVINSLLQNIDQFVKGDNILIAATNHPELLDRAIWRRFNTIISLEKPSHEYIGKLIGIFLSKIPNNILSDQKSLTTIERLFEGLSPSDIRTISNNAISAYLISGDEKLTYNRFVFEYFQFKQHGSWDITHTVEFLSDHGISEREIAAITGLTRYQVNKLKNKEV